MHFYRKFEKVNTFIKIKNIGGGREGLRFVLSTSFPMLMIKVNNKELERCVLYESIILSK